MLDPRAFWCISHPFWPEWFPWEPPFMAVVWSGLSYTLPMITQQLLSTVGLVDIVVEQISYAFYSSRSKLDLCESPSGLTTSSLPSPYSFFPSFLLSFWPLALTLHAVDFFPCSLKSRVSGESIWPEVSLMKLLDFGAVHSPLASSFSTSQQTIQPLPKPLTGLSPPMQRQHCFHY